MREKKECGRFTIKLNENDPAHKKAICLLERQRLHSKAQFIVDALLYYADEQAAEEKGVLAAIDRTAIEAIVRDILKAKEDLSAGKISGRAQPPNASMDRDGQAFSLISGTLSTFWGV